MTAAEEQLVAELAEALRPHQTWCQTIGHFDCCGRTDEDCDCGVSESLRDVLEVVLADRRRAVAEELREAADAITEGGRPDLTTVDQVQAVNDTARWLAARADAVEGGGR